MARKKKGPEGRRLHFDDEDAKIYENLIKTHGPFKGLNYIDLFSIAVAIGKKAGFRTELKPEGKSIGRVVESVIDNTELRYLMKAIAVEEEDSLGVILDLDKYFTISEEYAKTGLELLEQDFIANEEILDDMELEMIQFYNENIEGSEK